MMAAGATLVYVTLEDAHVSVTYALPAPYLIFIWLKSYSFKKRKVLFPLDRVALSSTPIVILPFF